MTKIISSISKKPRAILFFGEMVVFFAIVIQTLLQIQQIKVALLSTLTLVYQSLLPSLYPFMILSGIGTHFYNQFYMDTQATPSSKNGARLFLPYLMSVAFGFPIGAKIVNDLYNSRTITKGEGMRLFPLFNQTGFSFVTLVVGRNFLGSFSLGLKIYLVMILSSFLVFFIYHKEEKHTFSIAESNRNTEFSCVQLIKNSTLNMIYIIGFLLAFTIPSTLIRTTFKRKSVSLVLSGLLEITNGCHTIVTILSRQSILLLPALCFCVSFGGICVGMQSEMCVRDNRFSMKDYYIRKGLQGIFAFALGFFLNFL